MVNEEPIIVENEIVGVTQAKQKSIVLVSCQRWDNGKKVTMYELAKDWTEAQEVIIAEWNAIPKNEEDEKLFKDTCCVGDIDLQKIAEQRYGE